ncbi:MAG: hypothetical protein M0P69_04345 [Bacteroidales bacterium]|jgi:hypothetical protein|nr:hypothetical protein [Bacteroidales bacterium]MDD2570642.1 hypothetical protein [Bacteroidales bacterium]MDD2813367.1 hypothetical protein [Bacteroidales bacterium]MDD3811480.1 hypothetical protein [Bacteroidales bacterium]MDD3871035.1 hypothetical protein [Bacteroidales bacterium]
MKRTQWITGILMVSVVLFFASCGGGQNGSGSKSGSGSKGKSSNDFSKLIDFIENETDAITKLEEKQKKSTDLNEAFKFGQKIETQKETADKNIKDKLAQMGGRVDIPFTQDIQLDQYKLKALYISEASRKNLIIKAEYEEPQPTTWNFFSFQNDAGETLYCRTQGGSAGLPPSLIFGATHVVMVDKATYETFKKK